MLAPPPAPVRRNQPSFVFFQLLPRHFSLPPPPHLSQLLAGLEFLAGEVDSLDLGTDIIQTITEGLLEEQGLESLRVAGNPGEREEAADLEVLINKL